MDRYEKSFTDLWQKLGQEVFQASLGETNYAKNIKKSHRGPVVVDRAHPLAQCPNGFRLSSHLQEVIAYLGSDYVFEEASHLLYKLLGVDISAKQLQTISEHFGRLIEEEAQRQDGTLVSTQLAVSQEVYTYVQLDGSMVLTREENRTADAVERDEVRAYFSDSYSRS